MKQQLSHNEAAFSPQEFKTFPGALNAFFEKQCPKLGGPIMREALVKSVYGMVCQFFPETSHLKAGQCPWVAVDKNETTSYGKSMKNTSLIPVVVDVIGENDISDRRKGKRLRDIKIDAVGRICNSVDRQGGCLSQADLAVLLKISLPTVGNYIREWECENGSVLPRRGTVHDMGPTLTHKRIIIRKLFMEKLSVQETSRQTRHSYEAIHRYISAFKRTLLCKRKGLSPEETANALGCSARLVKQYLRLIDEFTGEGAVLEELERYDARIAPHYEEHPGNEFLPSEMN
jgi:DNA-binding CsgD family transcriptional regulator